MWKAFSEDTSDFKKKIAIYFLLSVLSVAAIFFLNGMRVAKVAENYKNEATFKAQSEWLRNFDFKEVAALQKAILKPVKAADVDKVQKEQLQILQNHGLVIAAVKNNEIKDKTKPQKSNIKSVESVVTVTGSWDNISAALNEFEHKNLVVITDLSINPANKDTDILTARLSYATYFM